MPKAKKSTRKSSSSRLSKVASWLKPNSPKKGLLLFAVVFAVAGGAYAVYKSHAQSWTVLAPGFISVNDAYVAQDCNGNKGCLQVLKMNIEGGFAYAKIYTHFSSPTPVFFCMTGRGQVANNTSTPFVSFLDQSASHGEANAVVGAPMAISVALAKSTTYAEHCASETINGGTHNVWIFMQKGSTLNPPFPSAAYISNVTMKW